MSKIKLLSYNYLHLGKSFLNRMVNRKRVECASADHRKLIVRQANLCPNQPLRISFKSCLKSIITFPNGENISQCLTACYALKTELKSKL